MTTLHGNWLIGSQDSVFFLWGEQWQGKELSETKENHPFCLESEALAQFIEKFSPQIDQLCHLALVQNKILHWF